MMPMVAACPGGFETLQCHSPNCVYPAPTVLPSSTGGGTATKSPQRCPHTLAPQGDDEKERSYPATRTTTWSSVSEIVPFPLVSYAAKFTNASAAINAFRVMVRFASSMVEPGFG